MYTEFKITMITVTVYKLNNDYKTYKCLMAYTIIKVKK